MTRRPALSCRSAVRSRRPDFKPVNRIQLSDIAALQKTNENGEFVRIYLGDSKEVLRAHDLGRIVPITRKIVITTTSRR